ncbi:MAG: tRNA (adenosine(37)-N6)-threonylcarbamoyltransferase complex transferase subunit TsaD [Clostridia bacterium]|nr:tRNA (adenosine(37)-N6)-threonylcarbamoyltransferase complex transferase subunit TsaD [Clostridia bacterium]
MSGYFERAKKKLDLLRDRDDITILGIESSCDETACAVLRGGKVLSSEIASQIDIHKRFGGVVPEIASRNHVTAIDSIVASALRNAGVTLKDIDVIGVTYGAGLLGALLVGVSYAKALAYSLDIPLMAVNHIKGHIAVNYIANPHLKPPYVCLIASGGHTAVAHIKDWDELEILGSTQDDACGEAFDKVARVLGLEYPGGPRIEKLAAQGKPDIILPRPFKGTDTLDFSFSGIKTAVINYVNRANMLGEEINRANLASSFQELVTDIMTDNAVNAAIKSGCDTLVIAGGVGANGVLRAKAEKKAKAHNLNVFYPPIKLCTDNGVMIAAQALCMIKAGREPAEYNLDADASVQPWD